MHRLHYHYIYSKTGFVRVMENLESHGILKNYFPGLEGQGIFLGVRKFLFGSWKNA